MSIGSPKNTSGAMGAASASSPIKHFNPTQDGWNAFREAVRKSDPAPVMGSAEYHYVPPGPTRIAEFGVADDVVRCHLEDGRRLVLPLSWFPILGDASPEERSEFEVDEARTTVFFPLLNADVTVDQMLAYHDGVEEDAFIAASASGDEDMLLLDIGALVRKACRVTGGTPDEILARVKETQRL